MKTNIGGFDGFLRSLIAVVCIAIAVGFNSWWLLLVALPLIVTNFLMYCPLYEVVGWNFSAPPQPVKHYVSAKS
jgi:hypothetical protein